VLLLSFNQYLLFAIHILQVNLTDDAKLSSCITRRSITVKKMGGAILQRNFIKLQLDASDVFPIPPPTPWDVRTVQL